MAFVKKTWEDRDSEYPNRRSLTDPTTGTTEIRDIGLAEGDVYVEGDKINAENFNDLEQRIEDAIDEIPITEVEVTPVVTDGETLATIRVNEDTSDIKMPKPYVVNITYNRGYFADKTYAEIVEAFNNGYDVLAHYVRSSTDEIFVCTGISATSGSAGINFDAFDQKERIIFLHSFRINPDNTVTYSTKHISEMPTPSTSVNGLLLTSRIRGGYGEYVLSDDNTIDDAHTNAKRTWSSQKINAELQARDAEIALKADSADVDTALALKADKADTYTKSQVDTALSAKANTSDVTASLALKADKADTYTKTEVDTALGLKADTATTYTKSEVDTALALKADETDLPTKTSDLTNDSDYQTGEQVSQTISEAVENKADTDGTYEDMTVGTAMKLVTTRHTTDIAPYLFRQSGGDNNAYVGTEETDKLVGASAVVNQLVNENTENWDEYSSSTHNFRYPAMLFLNHKYLVNLETQLTDSGNEFTFVSIGFWNSNMSKYIRQHITTPVRNYGSFTGIYVPQNLPSGTVESDFVKFVFQFISSIAQSSMKYRHFQLIDITAMFGTAIADYIYSLEQATAGSGIAYLRKYGFFTKDYYPYSANTLQSVKTSAHVMTGANLFNVLDYEGFVSTSVTNTRTETGYITTNSASANRTVNLDLGVLPFGNYYMSFVSKKGDNTDLTIFLIKNGVNQGGSTTGFAFSSNGSDTIILRTFVLANDSITVSNIQLQLGTTSTAYEPYVKHEYTLPNVDLRGLYKLDASNNLFADGDTLEGDGTLTRKYEQRPYQSGDESLADAITDGTNTVVKLATPTTEQVTGFTNPQIVDKYGTEEYVDERDFPLPVGHETDYPLDSEMPLPVPPVTAGTYGFKLDISASGEQTYYWG